MSEPYNFNIPRLDNEGNQIDVPHRAVFEGSTLTISAVGQDNDGNETLTPTMIQPFKTLPDGSRCDFVDAEDAFSWVDSMIGVVIT